jgi:hypothetical protein
MDALHPVAAAGWSGPFDPATQQDAVAALEGGRVLTLDLPFAVDAAEQDLLRQAGSDGRSKNVSLDPATGAIKGTALEGEPARRLAAIMRRFSEQAAALLLGLAPGYRAGLVAARTSFRPAEIAGRDAASWRRDDRRLHVDAFPSRPTRGTRILRVFTNADFAGRGRRWQVGEPFEAYAARFLPGIRPPLPGQAALMHMAGLTHGRRTRYDHLMLKLHDAAKRDAGYQAHAPQQAVEFPPGTTWIVFTDLVPHAALSGRNAFEQTFHLDPASMADPARAPLRILERLTGRPLAA